MTLKMLTREKFLALPDEPADRRVRDPEADRRELDRMIACVEADARVPAKPHVGWAGQALLFRDPSHWPFDEQARNIAAIWIADAFEGLPGDPRSRAEVWKLARRGAARDPEGPSPRELIRRLVMETIPEVVLRIGDHPAYRDTPGKRKVIADGLLVAVKRELRRADAYHQRHEAIGAAIEAVPAEIVGARLNHDLEAQIAALTPGQREVVAALMATGGDTAAAADRLGITRGALRSQVSKLRSRLQSKRQSA